MTVAMGFPNRIAAATLSGQGWLATLPLWHLTTRQLSQVARSHPVPHAVWFAGFASATEAGALALAGHNLTASTGQWRVRAYATDPRPAVDQSTQTATLDLPFDRNLLPPGLACTRASVATYFDSAGVLQTAAVDTVRVTHDAATLAPQGLLIESAATNLVQWSRDLSNAYWTKTDMTAALTAAGLTAAANSATRLTATASNATVKVPMSLASGVFSVWLRRVSGSGAVQITTDNFATTQAVTLTTAWQRFTRFTGTSGWVGVRIVTSGDVIEVDAAQAEAGTSATSPIHTAGGAVTRSADVVTYSVSAAAQPSLAVGTLAVTLAVRRELTSGGMQNLVTAQDAGGTSHVKVRMTNVSLGAEVMYTNAGATQATLALGASIALDEEHTVCASWAANNYAATRKGATPATDVAGFVSSAAVAAVVFSAPSDCAYTVRRLTFLPAASSSPELQALSTSAAEPAATYDTGWLSAWPAEWLAGTTAEQRSGMRGLAVHVPTTPVSALWWRIDARDPSLTSVEVGRAFLGGLWRPQYGMIVGATLGYDSRDLVADTDSGAEYTVSRPAPRVARFTLQGMGEDTAMDRALEMQRLLGTSGEVLYQWDHVDTVHQPRRALLGRLRTLQPLQTMGARYWAASYEVKELL